MLKRVCQEWREIALVCRDRVFEETEQEDIDLFDIKCKEWGFLLKELFGAGLGTGDYGHLTIDHAPMLMRRFLSMKDYSQQGFEASHKDQRQLWLKASSHDCKGECTSVEQMLVHFYAEKMLFLRYCFQEAVSAFQDTSGQNSFNFHFRGCGWKHKSATWDEGEQLWIKVVNRLNTMLFGKDHYEYLYNEKKVCVVSEDSQPNCKYDREQWNDEYEDIISEEVIRDVEVPVMIDTKDDINNGSKKKGSVSYNKRKLQQQSEHLTVECTDGTLLSKQPRLAATELQGELKPAENIMAANSAVDNQGNQNRVIATFPDPPSQNRVTILQMDMDTLEDGQELNDAIIDFFVLYMSYQAPNKDAIDKCHFFSSFFYTKLSERVARGKSLVLPSAHERHSRACSFTRRVDIFKKDFLFIPVCRSGHWFLLLIYNIPLLEARDANHQSRSLIFVMDSIAWSNRSTPSPREHEAEMMRSFLRCEWTAKKGSKIQIDDRSLPLVYPKVPQQDNGYDCGVYVLLFFAEFLQRKFPVAQLLSDEVLQWYDQSSALQLRMKIRQILLQLERK